MTQRRAATATFFAGLAAISVQHAAAAAGEALPAKAAPAGFASIEGSRGGRLVTGTLAGVTSPQGAFASGLQRLHGYFDGTAHVAGIVRSADGTTTLGEFSSTLRGRRVQGVVLAAYAPGVAPRIAVIYDRSGHLNQSVGPLLASLESIVAASAARPSPTSSSETIPPMRQVVAQDDTVSARLPAGWNAARLAEGVFVATNPDGSEVDQELSFTFADPRSPLAGRTYPALSYSSDPAAALEALSRSNPALHVNVEHANIVSRQDGYNVARVSGTQKLRNGVPGRFDGFIGVSPLGRYGAWNISFKTIAAPANSYRRHLPTLAAIFGSYRVNQAARNGQVHQYLADAAQNESRLLAENSAVQQRNASVAAASMASARNVQDSIDRSTAGFVRYLNETTVVQSATGSRAVVGQDFGTALVRANPQQFREVPVSEYRKGADF